MKRAGRLNTLEAVKGDNRDDMKRKKKTNTLNFKAPCTNMYHTALAALCIANSRNYKVW